MVRNRAIKIYECENIVFLFRKTYPLSDFKNYLIEYWPFLIRNQFKEWQKINGINTAVYDWKQILIEVNRSLLPALFFVEQHEKKNDITTAGSSNAPA